MFAVGDKVRQIERWDDCDCGCRDIWVIIEVTNDGWYTLIKYGTATQKESQAEFLEEFYERINTGTKKKTGFGKFICRIEE